MSVYVAIRIRCYSQSLDSLIRHVRRCRTEDALLQYNIITLVISGLQALIGVIQENMVNSSSVPRVCENLKSENLVEKINLFSLSNNADVGDTGRCASGFALYV